MTAAIAVSPLTPALFPEYRGEGGADQGVLCTGTSRPSRPALLMAPKVAAVALLSHVTPNGTPPGVQPAMYAKVLLQSVADSWGSTASSEREDTCYRTRQTVHGGPKVQAVATRRNMQRGFAIAGGTTAGTRPAGRVS